MNARKMAGLTALLGLAACASVERRFPLREPLWRDTDLLSVSVQCHPEPSSKDPAHVSCAPVQYKSPFYWDGGDNLVFRPLSDGLRLTTSGESVNVNSLDEAPDSAWFTNRLGKHPMTDEEIRLGACRPQDLLDPEHAPDESWLIHKGKMGGSTPGFRIKVPGKGEYQMKAENTGDQPERQGAASVISSAVLHAAGYNTTCEQIVYVRPSLFKLLPGLRSKASWGDEQAFDQRALDAMFALSPRRGGLLRFIASSWIKEYAIGSFRYEGTRADDPNDVIPHEDRRDLRGMRVLAAWINRFDAREGNTLDTWIADAKGGPPDASPGHVRHYHMDVSETLGSVLTLGDDLGRRMGHSYMVDFGHMASDFATLGALSRPWDTLPPTLISKTFGYFDVEHLVPERWKSEYSNAAFTRMTERDAAWMARILAHFSPKTIRMLATMGDLTDARDTEYLARVLEGRLQRILARYLTRLSPIADVRVEGDAVCGVDLAALRGVRAASHFRYSAASLDGAALAVRTRPGAEVCVTLPHVAPDGGAPDDAPSRYLRARIDDGVARGPLVVHLYDLGPARGFRLAGLERPAP